MGPDREKRRGAVLTSAPEDAATRVFIFSSNRLLRDGLTRALSQTPGVNVIGAAGNRGEVTATIRGYPPDVVLLDTAAAGSLDVARAIVAATPTTRVIALGISESAEDVVACAESGVAGYLTQDGSIEDLLERLQSVRRGETVCSPRVAAILLRRIAALAAQQRPNGEEHRLTTRERDIIRLIAQGLSNKEIAQALSIAIRTVKNHVHNILEKLEVHSRSEAVARIRGKTDGGT